MRAGLLLAALALVAGASTAQAETLCTLVADADSGAVLVEEGRACGARVTPASTFKIALGLIGFDAGILVDEHSPAWPFREGYADWMPAWRATTDPSTWMTNSVVWYSQQLTTRLGAERFAAAVRGLGYGNADVSGDPGKANGLTRAWLSSSLQISPREQIDFLRRVVRRKAPVSAQAFDMTDRITRLPDLAGGWRVHGKTGTGAPKGGDGKPDWNRAYGWFVGWAVKDGRRVVFARLVQDGREEKVTPGIRTRDALLGELPALLDRPPRPPQ